MFLKEALGPSYAGYIYPHATAEVIDNNNLAVLNQAGTLRVKSKLLVQAYKNNAEASRKHFKDGWFYPGDRAILHENGLLKLLGRENDFINRGGIKIDPAEVDMALNNFTDIEDAAVFLTEDVYGIPILVAAVVCQPNTNFKKINQQLISILGNSRALKLYLKVNEIPRNHMGKLLRSQLKKYLEPVLAEKINKDQTKI